MVIIMGPSESAPPTLLSRTLWNQPRRQNVELTQKLFQTQRVSAAPNCFSQPRASFPSAVIKITIFSPISYNFTKRPKFPPSTCCAVRNLIMKISHARQPNTSQKLEFGGAMIKGVETLAKNNRIASKFWKMSTPGSRCRVVRRTNRPNLILPFSLSCFIGFILTYL